MCTLHQSVLVRILEQVLIVFFVLAALSLVGVYVAVPSTYTSILLFPSSQTGRYPVPTTLFLFVILVFIAVLIMGTVRHWRWLFRLVLIAFSFSILEIPATELYLKDYRSSEARKEHNVYSPIGEIKLPKKRNGRRRGK